MQSHILLALALLVCVAYAVEEQCASYTPKTCVHSEKIHFGNRLCHPAECDFNVSEVFSCGFPETGEFSYEDKPDGCEDPFMSMHRRGPSHCGARCCHADHAGDFSGKGLIPGLNASRYEFQPTDSECRYEHVTRGQILHYLNGKGAPVVLFGDSMMRQLLLRLVMMLRGQKRLLDYHLHTNAHYVVCPEADVFRIQPGSASSRSERNQTEYYEGLTSNMPAFFNMASGPGRLAGHQALQNCSTSPSHFQYLHAPKWEHQMDMIPVYLASLPVGVKPIILLSVGFWEEDASVVPQKYLDVLESLRHRAHKVFIISAPTVRVFQESLKENVAARNVQMRQWVADHGDPFIDLDYEKIAAAEHPPPGAVGQNWHYMCSVMWGHLCHGCPRIKMGGTEDDGSGEFIPQLKKGTADRIHGTQDEMCVDEMNRNLWQIVFNAVLEPAVAGGGLKKGGLRGFFG